MSVLDVMQTIDGYLAPFIDVMIFIIFLWVVGHMILNVSGETPTSGYKTLFKGAGW